MGHTQSDQSTAALVRNTDEVSRVGLSSETKEGHTVGRCLGHDSISVLIDEDPDWLFTLDILDASVYSVSIGVNGQDEVYILINGQRELEVF